MAQDLPTITMAPVTFYAKLEPKYSTAPTVGGCVVFISGYTGSTTGTATDTFGPIIVPPSGCTFTGVTTSGLKQLVAVAKRPGYEDLSQTYSSTSRIGDLFDPPTIDLLSNLATATGSKRCPNKEGVKVWAMWATFIAPSREEDLEVLGSSHYPLWDIYTTATNDKVPIYSELYYDCSANNTLSGCSTNASCSRNVITCTGNCATNCTTDCDINCSGLLCECDSVDDSSQALYNGTVSVTFKTSSASNAYLCITGYTDGVWHSVLNSSGGNMATYGLNYVGFTASKGSSITYTFQYEAAGSIWFKVIQRPSSTSSAISSTSSSNKKSVTGGTQSMTCTISGTTVTLA